MATTATMQLVNVDELQRVEDWLWENEESAKGSHRFIAFVHPKTRRFTTLPMAQFIANGIPCGLPGRVSLMKKKDYSTRIDGLHRLEAYVRLLTLSTLRFEDVTEAMLRAEMEFVQANRDHVTTRASKWFHRPTVNLERLSRRRAA